MGRFDLHNERVWRELAPKCGYRLRALAALTGLSEVHLWRCSKLLFQKSPQKFLDGERIAAARGLLEIERSVKIVAAKLGYSRPHLSRVFKICYGVSPSGYFAADAAARRTKR